MTTRKAKAKRKPNPMHELLKIHLDELGLAYYTEVQVTPLRKWRFDFTLPGLNIAIEIDGFFKGRHQAFGKDYDKQNFAIMQGWKLLRFSTQDVARGRAKSFLAEHLKAYVRV